MLFAIRRSTRSLVEEIRNKETGVAETLALIASLIIGIMSIILFRVKGFVQGGGFMDTVKSMGIMDSIRCANTSWIVISIIATPIVLLAAKLLNK